MNGDGFRLLVVAGPGLDADAELLDQMTGAEADTLGVPGRFVAARDADALRDLLASSDDGPVTAVVVLPGPDPAVRSMLTVPGPHAARTVWYEPAITDPVPVPAGSAHFAGRGMRGLAWAIRHAVHRLRRPARRIRYGPAPDQWGELRLPPGSGERRLPVAVLLHGGYWRSAWAADLMDGLAIDLADRGYAAWNLEYRRPDRHGWDATVSDVAAGLAALADLPSAGRAAVGSAGVGPGGVGPGGGVEPAAGWRLDLDRVAVLGHSAGGQLALRLAADTADSGAADSGAAGAFGAAGRPGAVRVAVAVSLAGVVDLIEGYRRGVGAGAVPAALGGGPAEVPDAYAAADPIRRLPLGVPQVVVQGSQDDLDLIDFNRRYLAAATVAGDEVIGVERPGDHFAVVDPAADIWRATVDEVDRLLGR
nr:alpha/beta hydrolase [Micromonospora sp. DSM 115978]